jgi:ubiquinone/menaquinone biosynthesis C-methylase UbiE
MITPRQLKVLYEQGHNISAILRNDKESQFNTEETIEASYDLQSGSYIAAMGDASVATYQARYSKEIADTMRSLCEPKSILDAGVGEGTTLTGVVNHLNIEWLQTYGFDLSWSRVAYAKKWLASRGISKAKLCTGSLFHVPFCDDSIDIVYTSHSIEPNGGAEEPILKELYRVARSFLILLEPAYELADEVARQRMEYHGYCRNLKGISESLGYVVI